ncbi:hypothetical protein G9C85_00135 [Halorubellus sp. JP-L1]|uniref:hypothetical protein n=1 Tax=Halorubellus sp. JP-L1 TaxID=2715753 RepID=UPI00140BC320|nr:hypothetical protein [Halorubellus sp. JP-L1]NHN40046.1 hypothetical protein [Halorubellus sp. JP-L1]
MSDRSRALVLALVLVTSVVAGAGVAPALAASSSAPSSLDASSATSPPDGMTVIPDGNIQTVQPENGTLPIDASDLRGEVLTTDHPETLNVTVTTPEQADELAGENTSVFQSGQVAIILEDRANHDGRRIAMNAKALETALGYQPRVIHGAHSSGETWRSVATYSDGFMEFGVEKFSTNTVTFDGTLSLSSPSATSGSTYTYDVNDVDAVTDYNVSVTGQTATEWDNETALLANGESGTVSLAGNAPLRGPGTDGAPVIVLEGQRSTTLDSWTGTTASDDTIVVDGNQQPEDENITFTGSTSTTSDSASATAATTGQTTSVDVNGNLAPTDPTVTFTGYSTTTADSVAFTGAGNGASKSIDVNGNLAPTDESVSFTGNTQTTSNDHSGSSLSLDASDGISVTGNIDPTGPANNNPEVSVTANQGTHQSWDGTDDIFARAFGDWTPEAELTNVPDGRLSAVSFKTRDGCADLGQITTDIYVVEEGADTDFNDGTKVADGATFEYQSGWMTLQFDTPTDVSSNNIAVRFDTQSTENGGSCNFLSDESPTDTRHTYTSGGSTYTSSKQVAIRVIGGPSSVSVSANGENSASASIGSLEPGETQTTGLNIGSSASSLTFSGGALGSIDYTLTKTDRTATENPSIDVDGDGSPDASYSGILTEGETVTRSFDLSTTDSTVDVQLADGTVDLDASWTENTATENPSLDVDGDGNSEASYAGILNQGETAEVAVSEWTTSVSSVELNVGYQADYTLDWNERTATEDVGVDVDGDGYDDASVDGLLKEGETASRTLDLSTGSNTLGWSGTGPSADYELEATEVNVTEDPDVDVDGDGTYEVTHSGLLTDGETVEYDASEVTRSTDALDVVTNAAEVRVTLEVQEVTETEDPTVVVNGNATDYTGRLADGETADLTTDTAWVQEGTNDVEIQLASVSADAPQPSVGFNYSHGAQASQTVDYEATQWTERYSVSKNYASSTSGAELTIPFTGEVVEVGNLEMRTNGSTWSDVESADYSLENTTLTVSLGEVGANTSVDVRSEGRKVDVQNGSIQVLEPTTDGSTLDSRIKLESWAGDSAIVLPHDGDETLVRYSSNESWTGADSRQVIQHDGDSRLELPNAPEGGEARVSTIPVEVNSEGDVVLEVEDPRSTEPQFVVSPGDHAGDEVAFTYLEAKDGASYVLWSVTDGIARDSGTANSPITLVDDDSSEVLVFELDDDEETDPLSSPADVSGPGGPVEQESSGGKTVLLFATWVAAVLGTWFVARSLGRGRDDRRRIGIPFAGSIAIPRRSKTLPFGVAVGGGLFIMESLSGGAISAGIGRAISAFAISSREVIPGVVIIVVIGAVYIVYSYFKPRPINLGGDGN